MKFNKGVYFISGIDTDIGKTIATGYIAKTLLDQNINVITQKLVQTGNSEYSEDVLKHREMMVRSFPEDATGLTSPQIFKYPASPHLATRLENKQLELDVILQATQSLAARYDVVLLEGAGGLMVPLTEQLLTIDYIAQQQYPVVLVTSGRLGSINHTLLSLRAIKNYDLKLHAVVYNQIHDHQDHLIADDTKTFLKQYLDQNFDDVHWIELEPIG